MSFPAFKERFDQLTAKTQTRSQEVSRAAEVVSISLGEFVDITNSLVAATLELRTLLVAFRLDLRASLEKLQRGDKDDVGDIKICAATVAAVKRFHRRISRAYFENVDGVSGVATAGWMKGFAAKTSAEGRTMRRLEKRIRDAADDCEKQRLRLIETLEDTIVWVEAFANRSFEPKDFKYAYVQALGEQSINRFPVVNAYLAR